MIQNQYRKYIHNDGDALLRACVDQPKPEAIEAKTETFLKCWGQVFEIGGGPNGNRTRVPDVRGRCPNR